MIFYIPPIPSKFLGTDCKSNLEYQWLNKSPIKYKFEIMFGWNHCWIGIYHNPMFNSYCIALIPFCVIKISKRQA